jgi:hypothetical protein
MLGLALLLILINAIIMMQQYPRYIVFSVGDVYLDIKQHISFFVIMFALYIHAKRNTQKAPLEN